MISAVVAVAENGVIGKKGGLPWYLPAELAHFKEVTMSHPIIMGRKTHKSIGRTLPGRYNIIITSNPNYKPSQGSVMAKSLEQAIDIAKKAEGSDEIFIVGGEQIYKQAMSLIDRIYLTKVDAEVQGDKFFRYNSKGWRQISREKHAADDKNQYDYEFVVLERKR